MMRSHALGSWTRMHRADAPKTVLPQEPRAQTDPGATALMSADQGYHCAKYSRRAHRYVALNPLLSKPSMS
jgi:hypothetical protein